MLLASDLLTTITFASFYARGNVLGTLATGCRITVFRPRFRFGCCCCWSGRVTVDRLSIMPGEKSKIGDLRMTEWVWHRRMKGQDRLRKN